MEVKDLQEDLLVSYRQRHSFWVPDVGRVREDVHHTSWAFGPIFSERIYECEDDLFDAYISEASGTCVATQVKGPNVGLQAIAKIQSRMMNFAPRYPQIAALVGTEIELLMLTQLTGQKSTCTPKLLETIKLRQPKGYPVPGGFIRFIIMEKLPGRDLSNFGELPMSERDQVRLAFAKAIREFYALGYDHIDKANRNIMWDRENKKCYIIDLEDAVETNEPKTFIPELDFYDWEIAGPLPNTGSFGVDPMVPYDRQKIKDPDDSVLEKWAADAAGKEIVFPRYDLRTAKFLGT